MPVPLRSRILVADDHRVVRHGLGMVLDAAPDLEVVAEARDGIEAVELSLREDVDLAVLDVVLLDYHLPGTDGLSLCREIKSEVPAPAVILYSAFADDSMTVPAIVAGADGLLPKGVRPRQLFHAIREVAAGADALPRVSPPLLEGAGVRLDPDDLPILAMMVNRTGPADIAATLGIDRAQLRRRVRRMLGRLKVPVPAHAR